MLYHAPLMECMDRLYEEALFVKRALNTLRRNETDGDFERLTLPDFESILVDLGAAKFHLPSTFSQRTSVARALDLGREAKLFLRVTREWIALGRPLVVPEGSPPPSTVNLRWVNRGTEHEMVLFRDVPEGALEKLALSSKIVTYSFHPWKASPAFLRGYELVNGDFVKSSDPDPWGDLLTGFANTGYRTRRVPGMELRRSG
jgi:hypothetical protein